MSENEQKSQASLTLEASEGIPAMTTEEAIAVLKAAGHVVLREKSYRAAQERQRVAEALRAYADECRQGTDRWAQSVCQEERRIRDRLTFVYGVARAHGATVEELSGVAGGTP